LLIRAKRFVECKNTTPLFCFCRKGDTRRTVKKNPLKNIRAMLKLNPAAAAVKRAAMLQQQRRTAENVKKREAKARA